MSDAPTEPGGFVGDIYYGDPERTTFGTHRWNGTEWMKLASEADALTMLLGSARARIADLERQLAEARDALAVSAGRLTWCAGILPSKKLRDLVSEWADEARILSALKDPTP